eukprot:2289217-Prorocentrum_lima.AAC.1
MSRENREENPEGPWGDSFTPSGARSRPNQSTSLDTSRIHHSCLTWAKYGTYSMGRVPSRRRGT